MLFTIRRLHWLSIWFVFVFGCCFGLLIRFGLLDCICSFDLVCFVMFVLLTLVVVCIVNSIFVTFGLFFELVLLLGWV